MMRAVFLSLFIFLVSINAFALEIKSSAFENGGYLPDRYTCDGLNVSVPIEFANVPEKAKSLAIICDDPDTQGTTWVHWIVYNIAPVTVELKEGVEKDKALADGAVQGVNDFGEAGFGGACPPSGKAHHYIFKLYALDTMLEFKERPTKKEIEKAMTGHIIAEAKLTALYQRKNNN